MRAPKSSIGTITRVSNATPRRIAFTIGALLLLLLSGTAIRAAIPTWTLTGNATAARSNPLSFLLPDGTVLVVGGINTGTAADFATDRYNPDTGTWAPGPSALYAHPDVPAGVRLGDGRILITGGRYGFDVRRSAEIFDPATNTWTGINQMNAGRAGHTLTLLQDNRVLAAGGWDGGFLNSAEVYDPATGVWTTVQPMGQAKWFHSATLLADGRVLVAGGERYAPDTHFRETQYFNPGSGTWANGPLLNNGRTDHEAARLADGRVIVIGGLSGFSANSPLASTEIYDGTSWQFGAPMSAARLHFPLVVMTDGSLLVTGGTDTVGSPQTALAGAERYDPSTNTWSSSGVMNSPRRFHTATQLANGRVLVVGGSTATTSLMTSEIMGDTIAPVTTVSPSIAPNGNGWNNSDVTVTLSATDAGGSGVQSIVYSLSGAQSGSATIASATTAVTISSEGITTIAYHATDAEGNVEAGQTLAVKIDKTLPVLAPQAHITVPATAGGTVVDFSPSASDVPSGIVSIASSPLMSGMRFPAGTTAIQLTALDAAGNSAVASFNVTVVPSAPVITVTGGDFVADSIAHPASAVARDSTGAAVAGAFNIVYAPGGASAPSAAGRYSASASFTSNDAGILSATPWTTMAPDPNPKTTPRVVAINGKLYVYGFDQGATQSSFVPRLSIYDPATNTWSIGRSPNLIRAFASVGVIGGKMYVAGGCLMSDCRVGITNQLEIYDPENDSWAFGPAMTNGRFGSAAGVVDGRFVVTGGIRECPPCSISNETEVYDPATLAWTARAPIPVSHELPASAVVNGLLYVIGGYERNPANTSTGAVTGRVDVYDLASNTWTTRAAMPTARTGAASGVVNGAIYVIGGSGSGPLATNESYDPISNTWFKEAPMQTARFYVSTGVLNSKLYVIDGFNGASHVGTNERFDPSLTAHITIGEPANVAPTASFTASPNPAACQQPVSFNGSLSTAGPGRQIVSYVWNYGDGTVTTGNLSSVNHGYGGFGSYPATLTVTDNSVPALSASTSVIVEVSLGNASPVATHGGPYAVDLGTSVQLIGSGSHDPNAACGDSIASYEWKIDGALTLNGMNPILTAAQIDALGVGPHNVSLKVTDEFGLNSTATTTLSIYNNVPTASFTANPNPVSCNQVVSFNAFGSSAGRPDRQIVNYSWNFGDGSSIISGMASSLNHGYGQYGSYTATLTVTDNNVPARSASTSTIIVVSQGNQPPQANPGGPYSANTGTSVQLNGTGSSDSIAPCGDSIVNYAWTIDGSIQLSGPNPTLDLAANNLAAGSHSVLLRVTDEFGATGTSSTTLNVNAVLVSVAVSPSTASLSIGQNQTFQAIGHYSDGTTRMLPSSGNGGGNGGGGGFSIVPHWNVQFVSSQINLSVCATAQSPAPITFSSQAINDRNGVIDETWSPGTPVVTVGGTIDATTVNLTLVCTTSPVAGTITAQWTGTKYEGTFSFNGSNGTVAITGWSQHAPMPVARFSLAAAASGGIVYAFGGIAPNAWSTSVDAYNPATNSWTTVAQMATPRTGAGAVTLNGKIYVVGGHVAGGIASGIIESYDPANGSWDTTLTPMSTPRAHLAVVTDGVYIYAIGGDTTGNNGGVVSTVERYDPSANSWSTLASMPSPGSFIVAGVLNGAIVVAGSGGSGGPSSNTDIYEIASNTWRPGPPMPAGRTLAAAGVANGGLYLVGGTVNGSPAHDAWVFYPATNFRPEYWGLVGPMEIGRSQLAAAVVDDVIYALGGMVPGSNPTVPLATNEVLSTPPLNTFAPSGGSAGNGGGNNGLPTVEWQSTNPAVAGIDASGNAHANTLGQTTIVAVLSNGMTCVSSNTCATLTVVDTQAPFLGLPNNQTRQANSPSGATNLTYFVSANDSVDGPRPVTCNPLSGSTFPMGETTVQCSSSDLSGNTANGSFKITVIDTNPPFMNGPNGDQFRMATGPTGAIVTWTMTANDTVDGPRPVTCNPPSGSPFPFGPTEVTCTASDTRNNVATRKFTVIVQDTQPPFLNVPFQPVRKPATSAAGAVVDFGQFVSANDGVDGAVTPTCSPSSGSVFPIGPTSVTCHATDARNNQSQPKSFTLIVEDRPIVVVPANIIAEATSAAGSAVPFTASATTFGAGPVPVSCVIITSFVDDEPQFGAPVSSGSVFPLGTTMVGCLAMDEGELFTITVVDTVTPALRLVSPLADDFVATAPANVTVDVEAIDAVGVTGVTINGINATVSGSTPAGTLWRASVAGPAPNSALTLTLRATDAAGHAGAVTAIIDNDGIAAAIDRNRVTGADQRGVYSSEFNDGTTAGTINRLTGSVTAVQSGAAVRIGMASPGIAHVSACSGTMKYVVLDEQGESADVSCAAGGTVTATAHTVGNGKVELYKSRPEDFFLAQIRCSTFSFFLPLHLRYSPQCSQSPSPVSYYYSYQVKLKDGETASTGSPVTASPDNTGPIEVTLLQIDDERNEIPVADFTLDPGESADVSITPGIDRADHMLFSVLNGTVTFVTGVGEQTVDAGGQATVTVDMTLPPLVVTTSGDMTVEAASAAGSVATFTATAVDAGGNPTDVTCSPASGSTFPMGDTTVTCSSTDVYGSTGSATLTVHVVDTVAPAISGVVPSQATHGIDSAPVCQIASVASSEPVNGLGDGDAAPDWAVTGALSVDLRAERAGTGPGRVYTITVQCVDDSGNTATAVAQVTVAHDNGK
jgi:N-acetylneuraminic acid mutarotase